MLIRLELQPQLDRIKRPIVKHQNNFHFVRFMAAILVLFGHSYALTNRPDWLLEVSLGLFPTGSIAVFIFFVVSGYLITQSLQNSPTTTNFILKRLLRIYPGLIVSVLITLFIIGPVITTLSLNDYFFQADPYTYLSVLQLYPPPAYSKLSSLFNQLPGVFKELPVTLVNGSLWTLCYEVSFYMILLIVARLGGLNHRLWLLTGTCLAWVIMLLIGVRLDGTAKVLPILNLDPFATLDWGLFFAAGVIARLYDGQITYNSRFALLALAVWIGTYWLIHFFPVVPVTAIRWVRYPALSYLVLYFCFIKGPLNRFGDWGDISYGLYIYGFPLQQMLIVWLGAEVNAPILVILSIAVTLPVAIGSWFFVEQPALKWKMLRT